MCNGEVAWVYADAPVIWLTNYSLCRKWEFISVLIHILYNFDRGEPHNSQPVVVHGIETGMREQPTLPRDTPEAYRTRDNFQEQLWATLYRTNCYLDYRGLYVFLL
jgi:hypothetical protein